MFNKKDSDPSHTTGSKSEPTMDVDSTEAEDKRPEPTLTARSVSYIGPGLKLTGDVDADEGLVIEGEVEGRITSVEKNLTVGKKGRIKGDIVGSVIELRGTVEGEVYSDELLRLYSSAVVTGKIFCKRLVFDEGAEFNGTVDMNWDGKVRRESPANDDDADDNVVRVAR